MEIDGVGEAHGTRRGGTDASYVVVIMEIRLFVRS